MGLLFGRTATPTQARGVLQDIGVPFRSSGGVGTPATTDEALRSSAVWAALRLRADLISTLPVDVYRKTSAGQVPAPGSRLLTMPAYRMNITEWLYSSQMDLDRFGNFYGHITARDAMGYPVQVQPWPALSVGVITEYGLITGYRYNGRIHDPADVWHEKQYTVTEFPFGLSPVAYAAWTTGTVVDAQQFALDWFAASAHPAGTLRNTEQSMLEPKVLDTAKQRFKVAVANRDLFVTGKDWEFTPAVQDATGTGWLAQMQQGATEIARYFNVPADSIDAGTPSGSITYANVAQRQLSLLVNHLAPTIARREAALTAALPAPRFVKFNADAMLRLDPAQRTELIGKQIDAWVMTPDEARALENRPPLTPEQIDLLKSRKTTAPAAPDEGAPQ